MHDADTNAKGRAGESLAVTFLENCGYRVIERNVRLPDGEIDLVCLDGRTLVFVEVKRRDSRRFGSALGAVDARKRAKLRALAADYAQVTAPKAAFRFDIVAIEGDRATLHRNAF